MNEQKWISKRTHKLLRFIFYLQMSSDSLYLDHNNAMCDSNGWHLKCFIIDSTKGILGRFFCSSFYFMLFFHLLAILLVVFLAHHDIYNEIQTKSTFFSRVWVQLSRGILASFPVKINEKEAGTEMGKVSSFLSCPTSLMNICRPNPERVEVPSFRDRGRRLGGGLPTPCNIPFIGYTLTLWLFSLKKRGFLHVALSCCNLEYDWCHFLLVSKLYRVFVLEKKDTWFCDKDQNQYESN